MAVAEYVSNAKLLEQAENIMTPSIGPKGPDYFNSRWKRSLDVVVASTALLPSSPLILVASALVYGQDRHNPFFDKVFTNPVTGERRNFWKVRSMVPDAELEEEDLIEKRAFYFGKNTSSDSRVTPMGKILRKTSIDELPQFFNILRGGYSIVGPRIYTKAEWDQLIECKADRRLLEDFKQLLSQGMKFGLTGLAVLLDRNNERPDMINDRLALSIMYGEKANFLADLRIIGLTSKMLFKGR